jgi:hypothetical protein
MAHLCPICGNEIWIYPVTQEISFIEKEEVVGDVTEEGFAVVAKTIEHPRTIYHIGVCSFCGSEIYTS